MVPERMDLSIFNKFNFSVQPFGMKLLFNKPEGIQRLEKDLALCEMFKEAQSAEMPFYTDSKNHTCGGGTGCLGMGSVVSTISSIIHSGRLGPKLKIFKDPIANRRTLLAYPRLEKDTVNYVVFSPLNKLQFDPDVLLVTAEPRQAEIILRALSYTTGALWEPRTTSIVGCSWLVAYPILTGKLNYTMTGLGFGMIARELWPQGLMLLSIPYDLLSMISQNLREMEWVLPSYQGGRANHIALEDRLFKELSDETNRIE